jgi:hypothetical protein
MKNYSKGEMGVDRQSSQFDHNSKQHNGKERRPYLQ